MNGWLAGWNMCGLVFNIHARNEAILLSFFPLPFQLLVLIIIIIISSVYIANSDGTK